MALTLNAPTALKDLPAVRRQELKSSGRNSHVLQFPLKKLADSVR